MYRHNFFMVYWSHSGDSTVQQLLEITCLQYHWYHSCCENCTLGTCNNFTFNNLTMPCHCTQPQFTLHYMNYKLDQCVKQKNISEFWKHHLWELQDEDRVLCYLKNHTLWRTLGRYITWELCIRNHTLALTYTFQMVCEKQPISFII